MGLLRLAYSSSIVSKDESSGGDVLLRTLIAPTPRVMETFNELHPPKPHIL